MAGMLSSSRVERALLAVGFLLVSTRGSHKKFRAPGGGIVVLPLGHTQVLASYAKKACAVGGVDWQAFLDRYWNRLIIRHTYGDGPVKTYDVLLSRDPESGWYGVEVPDLPGCYSQGETEQEALENVRQAIALYLSDVEDVPPATEHRLERVEIG